MMLRYLRLTGGVWGAGLVVFVGLVAFSGTLGTLLDLPVHAKAATLALYTLSVVAGTVFFVVGLRTPKDLDDGAGHPYARGCFGLMGIMLLSFSLEQLFGQWVRVDAMEASGSFIGVFFAFLGSYALSIGVGSWLLRPEARKEAGSRAA